MDVDTDDRTAERAQPKEILELPDDENAELLERILDTKAGS